VEKQHKNRHHPNLKNLEAQKQAHLHNKSERVIAATKNRVLLATRAETEENQIQGIPADQVLIEERRPVREGRGRNVLYPKEN
jgi:hypothetical protein